MTNILVSDHAKYEIQQRNIDEKDVIIAAETPQQSYETGKGRLILQRRYFDRQEGKEMLLRLVIEKRGNTLYIITVYKTSKVEKYWRKAGGTHESDL